MSKTFSSSMDAAADGASSMQPVRRPADGAATQSLVDEVYHRLLARVVRGELPGGTELKSTQLAGQLGVSRTPVVQALSRLIADGIVTQRLNMRAVVRPGAENWLVEIHELRLLVEPAAAARAALNITPEAIAALERAGLDVAPETDAKWTERARQFDFQLHRTLADHCDNLPLRGAIYKCWQYKGLSYELGSDDVQALLRGYEEHMSIVAAVKVRDAQTAAAAMELHLRHASSYRPAKRIV